MSYLTYSLNLEQLNSDKYYNQVAQISNKILKKGILDSEEYLNDFMNFINDNEIENLRSKEEYFIELLLIGVVIEQYKGNARAFKNNLTKVFRGLNNIREKESLKKCVDKLRGKLISKILLKKVYVHKEISLDDFILIIEWLEATGDFKEEVKRLNSWETFLETKNKKYISEILNYCYMLSKYLKKECKNILGKYTKNVEGYLEKYKEKHYNKEDIIYCGKEEIQYFFNMVSAEIMNSVYRDRFLNSYKKLVFLPACMRQTEKACMSKKTNKGYECIGCSIKCNVNKLRKIGQAYNFKVHIIPHETLISNLVSEENSVTGMIGIACVLNLVSGGWKAIRLGFIPQCIILDYVGCSNHWLDKAEMTRINIDRINNIFKTT
ncbi:hypothetical protein psyc5s11_39640 [Clostridium gelidum]|uniref:DUF116 domain-containing protein n=1 Tax=Clostridium gelidum TaxID=704125 RepID=A0ABN6J562_9CLOT|nr:DUF116 domain-containing protein [Clostridium gelidum]BCZ47897.1 hypothetical protein psyc5s11_39640 [Clostridium gelidum]